MAKATEAVKTLKSSREELSGRLRAGFDAQAQYFHQPQSAAIYDLGHDAVNPLHIFDDSLRLGLGEYDGDTFGFAGTQGGQGGFIQFQVEDVAIEKQDSAEGFTSTGSVQGFWVEAAKFFSTARWVMNWLISATPISRG